MTLSVEDFGEQLIRTGDLDPIYNALHGAQMPEDQLYRWLLAYVCFYHAGFASYIVSLPKSKFWEIMMTAAENAVPAPNGGRWPRASERRHFRGRQATDAMSELYEAYGDNPSRFIRSIATHSLVCETRPVSRVFEQVKRHRGFGDWVAFKISDLLDRCTPFSVDFDNAHVFMFESPVEGAQMAVDSWNLVNEFTKSDLASYVVARLVKVFSERGLLAPPKNDRPINVQEVETVLCKWKSHVKGRYPVGHDIAEIRHGFRGWEDNDVAQSFIAHLPPLVQVSEHA